MSWDDAIAESARLAIAFMNYRKDAKVDEKEGRNELALRKERLLAAASDAWDRGDLSACSDFLTGIDDIRRHDA